VFPEDSAQFASQKIRFPTSRPNDVSYRPDAQLSKAPAIQTTCHTVWMHIRLKHHPSERHGFPIWQLRTRSDDLAARPDDPQCSAKASGFLSKTQIWEDFFNRPDDVDSRPDTLIDKASITIQIQSSGRRSSWSERECIKYGNCVHQIDLPDGGSPEIMVAV
jgi:hypothetical protein